jgi:hypothetical protein
MSNTTKTTAGATGGSPFLPRNHDSARRGFRTHGDLAMVATWILPGCGKQERHPRLRHGDRDAARCC